MTNWPNTPKEKPEFDSRVKKLWQIEAWLGLVSKITGLLIFSLILIGLFGLVARASDAPDLFLVPVVKLTHQGATVFQPQTGDGYSALNKQVLNEGVVDGFSSFRAPQYDAFADGTANMKVNLPEVKVSTAEQVDFIISNDMPGSSDANSGTTKTVFNFMAQVETNSLMSSDGFQYRWDFDGDGKIDSFFSYSPTVGHQFKKAGVYNVKLQVLDKAGRVSEVIKPVTIVENDPPQAVFSVDKIIAAVNSIFRFDTSLSSDNQYSKGALQYRFDWDNDGQWDTTFQNKVSWNHLYREPGNYTVTMQAIDPEGATAQSQQDLTVEQDSPPVARMNIARLRSDNDGKTVYEFDASDSYDDHTKLQNLRFRWDFNYGGPNDIVFDTSWSNSPKYTGTYHLGGNKTIRLQVMDEQGQVSETFAQLSA